MERHVRRKSKVIPDLLADVPTSLPVASIDRELVRQETEAGFGGQTQYSLPLIRSHAIPCVQNSNAC
jgi:hypothetical protein